MFLMRISIKKVSITDIFFTVFIFLLYQAIWSNFMRRILLSMFLKGWSNIFIHKFLKFWCTHQLFFLQVFVVIIYCKSKLVCIEFNTIHFLNFRTFFFKMIFFKIFVHWLLIFNGIWANVFRLSFRYQFLLRQIKRSEKEEIGVQHSFHQILPKLQIHSKIPLYQSYLIWWQNNISKVPKRF